MLRIPQTSEFLLNSDKFEFSWILMRILMRILIRIRFEWFDRSPTEPFNLGPPLRSTGFGIPRAMTEAEQKAAIKSSIFPMCIRSEEAGMKKHIFCSSIEPWREDTSIRSRPLRLAQKPLFRFSDFLGFLSAILYKQEMLRRIDHEFIDVTKQLKEWSGPHPFRIPRFRLSTPKLCFQADNLIAGNLIAGNLQVWLQCAQRYSIRGMLCRKRKAADADSADQVDQFHQKEFELPPGYKGQEDVGHANGYDPAKYTEQQLRGVACEAWFKYFGRRRRWSFPRFPKETERFYYFYACHYYLLNYHWWQYEYEPQEPTALPLKNAKMLTN